MSERNRSSDRRVVASARSFCSMVAPAMRITKNRTNAPIRARALVWARERKDREHLLPDADLPDGDARQAPQGGDPPDPRAAPGHVLEGQEGVRPAQDRPPPAQVDDRGDRGGLDGHPQVQSGRGGPGVVEVVGDDTGQGDDDEDGHPQPGRLLGHLAEAHEQQQRAEGGRPHEVGQLPGVDGGSGRLGGRSGGRPGPGLRRRTGGRDAVRSWLALWGDRHRRHRRSGFDPLPPERYRLQHVLT